MIARPPLQIPHRDTRVEYCGRSRLNVHSEACLTYEDDVHYAHFVRFFAYCGTHGGHRHFDTRREAREALLTPWEWCDGCERLERMRDGWRSLDDAVDQGLVTYGDAMEITRG